VGLPEVNVLGVDDGSGGTPLRVHVETRGPRPHCPQCASPVLVKDRPIVELVDLPVFGRQARLVWRKQAVPERFMSGGVLDWGASPDRGGPVGVDGSSGKVGDRTGRSSWPHRQ